MIRWSYTFVWVCVCVWGGGFSLKGLKHKEVFTGFFKIICGSWLIFGIFEECSFHFYPWFCTAAWWSPLLEQHQQQEQWTTRTDRSSIKKELILEIWQSVNRESLVRAKHPVKKVPAVGILPTQKWKTYLLRIHSSKGLPLKPWVGQNIAMHASPTARGFFLELISTFLVRGIHNVDHINFFTLECFLI